MARCRPCRLLFSLNPPDQIDRGANNSWDVPDVLYNPQALNNFLPEPRKVWEPSPSTELPGAVAAVPEGRPCGRDLLQQCLWAAGITEQLLEAEAKRDPATFQPSTARLSSPQMFPGGSLGQQPLLQPSVQHLGPFSGLQLGVGPARPGAQRVRAAAMAAPQVVLLQQASAAPP